MQYSAELLAVHTHEANLLQAERRIAHRRAAEERAAVSEPAGQAEPVAHHRSFGRRGLRPVLR
ncbi:hypothetical protein [Agromyces italicus]|uniref:hypothetical protein n=1 Tax=Agromyces italicus TaxID=279572 RepID=UPI0004299CDA|nr:hypothetical protein [Agromyces italicus]